MKNKEKYIDALAELIANEDTLAVEKDSNKPVSCGGFYCVDCLFDDNCNYSARLNWLEAEYQEHIELTDD